MKMEEIAARMEIEDLIHGYLVRYDSSTYSFDDDVLAKTLEYVTPRIAKDVLITLPTGQQLQGAGQITDRIKWLAANAKQQQEDAKASGNEVAITTVRHHITSTMIEIENDAQANGLIYFFMITDIGLDHSGTFTDKYRKENGNWMLSERKVTLDYMSKNTLFGFLHDQNK